MAIGSRPLPECGQASYFHLQPLLVVLVSGLEDLRVLVVDLLAGVEALVLDLGGLHLAGLHALVELLGELEVDLHPLLPLRGVDCLDVCAVQHVSLNHPAQLNIIISCRLPGREAAAINIIQQL